MFDFDLSDTKAGQELFEMGEKNGEKKAKKKWRKEGRKNFLLMLLKSQFGKLPKNFESSIKKSTPQTLSKLGKSMFNFDSIEDVYEWWNLYGKTVKK